jgi:hypothetical protein
MSIHECELIITEDEHGEDLFACAAWKGDWWCAFVGNLEATIRHVVENQFRVNS